MTLKRALVTSTADVALEAERELRRRYEWVDIEHADMVVALKRAPRAAAPAGVASH